MSGWRNGGFLLPANGVWESAAYPLLRRREGKQKVMRALRGWSPLIPVMIATPNATRFDSPINAPELQDSVHSNLLFRIRILLWLAIFMGIALTSVVYVQDGKIFFNAIFFCSIFFFYYFIFYYLICKPIPVLSELSRFVLWVFSYHTHVVGVVAILMIGIGLIQASLSAQMGGMLPVLSEYGLVYDAAKTQWWRYAVGPFFHLGFVHWFSNFFMLLYVARLAITLGKGTDLLAIFAAGVYLSVLLVGVLVDTKGFAGISGGVFSLLGWVFGVAYTERTWFPARFWCLVLLFSALMLVLASLFDKSSSFIAHGGGYVLGMVLGYMRFGSKVRNGALDG